ncbi:MAG TPA: permease [Arsenicitalea sp.]|jgi:ABC-2 type transport system permease protein|nr:permease [Arsenicitalea sp.]
MIARPSSLLWFARHETGLFWREWIAMMTGGKRRRGIVLFAVLVVVAVVLHLMANALVGPWVAAGIRPDKPTLVLLTGGGLMFWSVMLSQAMESVTRAYYARSDLDLILSSPASSRKVFAVRTGAIALSTIALSCLLAAPMIDMLVVHDGPRWLAAYGVLVAVGALSAAIAVLVTIALFRTVGPKRTRLIAQIMAAVVGAGFIIGIQAAAILAFGNMSRFEIFQSQAVIAAAPELSNLLWWPARAAMGDVSALLAVAIVGLGSLAAVIVLTSSSFGQHAIAAAGVSQTRVQQRGVQKPFRRISQRQALRKKEWALLRRDPWLLSQTLMQLLYLLPPALLLWLNYGSNTEVFVVVIPVLVMASGQLAGGLAWLCISGEDAHDLVTTAPIAPRAVMVAKVEAVLGAIVMILAPLLLLIAFWSWQMALIAALGIALAATSATAIQMWFRVPSRRSMFRRRQVASRTATLSEAFASIMWAGAAALVASGLVGAIVAVVPAVLALGVLGLAWLISPKGVAR